MAADGCYLPSSNLPQAQGSVHRRKYNALAPGGKFLRVRETFYTQQFYKLKNIKLCRGHDAKISINQIMPELSFDRLQPTVEQYAGQQSRMFGAFVARSAIVDEEYWAAAWLRAEALWESESHTSHVDLYKLKYAQEEFYALKRRCSGQDGNSLKYCCIVAVKKEDPRFRRTVINSTVGTLDLSIRQFVPGEAYPEIRRSYSVLASQEPFDTQEHGYIANVSVAKFARRRGIASNMLLLAADVATKAGLKTIFVHVNAGNHGARHLFEKTGFKVVAGAASPPPSRDRRTLMSMGI